MFLNFNDFFWGIGNFCTNVLFAPLEALSTLELSDWWASNVSNWMFVIIGLAGFVYWSLQLIKFKRNGNVDKDVSAHSFL